MVPIPGALHLRSPAGIPGTECPIDPPPYAPLW